MIRDFYDAAFFATYAARRTNRPQHIQSIYAPSAGRLNGTLTTTSSHSASAIVGTAFPDGSVYRYSKLIDLRIDTPIDFVAEIAIAGEQDCAFPLQSDEEAA